MSRETCCVPRCNYKSTKSSNVSYYRMPADESLRRLWMLNIFGVIDNKYKDSFVCSFHFKETDFNNDYKSTLYNFHIKKVLKGNALPTLNMRFQSKQVTLVKTVINKLHQSTIPMGVVISKPKKVSHLNTALNHQLNKEKMTGGLTQKINTFKADLKAEKEKCLVLQRKMAELKNKVNELYSTASDIVDENLENRTDDMFNMMSNSSRLDDILINQR